MGFTKLLAVALGSTLTLSTLTSGQYFKRTGTCPELGCIFPPTQTAFIAGQAFDIRVEVQAPVNGSEAYNGGVPNPSFKLEIGGEGAELQEISAFYGIADPIVESYNFTYYEDLFAQDAKAKTTVNVLAKSYRHITLYNPGEYIVKLTYNNGAINFARWTVNPVTKKQVAKNVILFIGDGMTTSMITAARLLAHKSINGKYQTTMAMDKAPAFGMQMTHSVDSFITDSANSASALMSGKKLTVNALNSYTDSTGSAFDGPKVETVFEMARRIYHQQIGIVSTAYLADATPAGTVTHTSQRGQYDTVIAQYLDGMKANYTWTKFDGPDVLFGGGGSDFLAGPWNKNASVVDKFVARGYNFVSNQTQLGKIGNDKRALGLFHASTMSTWLDRHIYPANLAKAPKYDKSLGATDQPGLKDMTLKAIDILSTRAKEAKTGWMLMSEAASIDKAMHVSDYSRALGEVLEFDDTIAATLAHLEAIGELKDTLVIVTADHGHGFDVYGSADTKYLAAGKSDRLKRNAIGTYQNSGLSEYMVAPGQLPGNNTTPVLPNGEGFPAQWAPRYAAAFGLAANVDKNENFVVNNATRRTSVEVNGTYFANPDDDSNGFFVSGNLPVDTNSGVHSLTDVPVYAWGPGHEAFRGHMSSVDIAFKIADAMQLGRQKNVTYYE